MYLGGEKTRHACTGIHWDTIGTHIGTWGAGGENIYLRFVSGTANRLGGGGGAGGGGDVPDTYRTCNMFYKPLIDTYLVKHVFAPQLAYLGITHDIGQTYYTTQKTIMIIKILELWND
eukprot:GHVO01033216.1.p2 GENE.GHVO01033216.1~~GHVO01033216.1.p2  ORF type:complete len:118 (-),score=23.46 GHVO01033216.1:245-598(-)